MMSPRVLLAGLVLGMAGTAGLRAVAAGEAVAPDCGTLALHTLLSFEGRPVSLAELGRRLPPTRPEGHSMLELREAARAFGLRLVGVRLPESDRAPDRPALAYLARGTHGHFVALRPVGHSGKLVQVLDSNEEPLIIDAVELYASPGWTGLALVPARPNWPSRAAASGAALLGLAAVVQGIRPRRQRRGPTPSLDAPDAEA